MSDESGQRDDESREDRSGEEAQPDQGSAGPSLEGIDFEDVSDLHEDTRETLTSASSIEHTSDALYIVREANYLFELDQALEDAGIELKEEVG